MDSEKFQRTVILTAGAILIVFLHLTTDLGRFTGKAAEAIILCVLAVWAVWGGRKR